MRKIMPADYAWEDDWPEEIYTVTFVRGLNERETLRRFGVADDNIHPVDDEEVMERIEETDGCCDMVLVTRAGDWTIAFEYCGWEGTRPETLRELGLEPEPEEEFPFVPRSVPAALALASRISGVLFTPALLDGPLLGGVITDAVPDDPREGDPLARHALRAFNQELAEAIDNASPGLQRRAAVAEARRQCEVAGVADHPVLAAAPASAERGEPSQVGHDSPLAEQ